MANADEPLKESIDQLGAALQGVSLGLQVKLGRVAENLERTLDTSTQRLSDSLGGVTAATDAAAQGSAKHARNLAWATWALVAVTLVLATSPFAEHFLLRKETDRQRECKELASYLAGQIPIQEGPWAKDPIVGAPKTEWSHHPQAVAGYMACLKVR